MTVRTGAAKSRWNGILPVNKPVGITSHDVVDYVRQLLGQRKMGHTGTLDPKASGLLLLCLGGATRFSRYLTSQDKIYRAVISLGLSTSTDDTEGEVTFRYPGDLKALVTEDRLKKEIELFTGVFSQMPPVYSSKKIAGVPAYTLARRGEKPILRPVTVRIDSIAVVSVHLPHVEIELKCSAGTYLRSLARDLGVRLGCGGHLFSLIRTAIGDFKLEKSYTLEHLQDAGAEKIESDFLIPVDKVLWNLPAAVLSEKAVEDIYHGRPVEMEGSEAVLESVSFTGTPLEVRLHDRENRFLGVGLVCLSGESTGTLLYPKRLMMEAFA
jgi:tRNA pseudouridine55 synthase